MLDHAPEFFAVATIVIVTPGQDTALTIRNTLLGGRRAGVHTALGVSTGQALWALAAGFGVAALLAASEPAFRALKLLGAAYLVYLGIQSLLAAATRAERAHTERTSTNLPARIAYRQGVISNLGNPKMAAFFLSLLPQFTSGEATVGPLRVLDDDVGVAVGVRTRRCARGRLPSPQLGPPGARRGRRRRARRARRSRRDRASLALYRALSRLQAPSQRTVICLQFRPPSGGDP